MIEKGGDGKTDFYLRGYITALQYSVLYPYPQAKLAS